MALIIFVIGLTVSEALGASIDVDEHFELLAFLLLWAVVWDIRVSRK